MLHVRSFSLGEGEYNVHIIMIIIGYIKVLCLLEKNNFMVHISA